MKTRLTELLGIKYPIVQTGMSFVALPQLAAAVSEAGGLGILAVSRLTPEEIRESIKAVKALTDKPFAANIVYGVPRFEELARVAMEEQVPVLAHGRGNPGWLIKASKDYDSVVIPSVAALRHAIRAEKDGADAVILQGWEGGGHTGAVATTVLLPLVANKLKIPIVAAGGFCDGRGLVAALALGAEGIAMGTRFVVTQESPVPANIKEMYLRASAEDTVITRRITGSPGRHLNNKLMEIVEKRRSLREYISGIKDIKQLTDASIWQLMISGLRMKKSGDIPLTEIGSLASATKWGQKGLVDGDEELGSIAAGQVCGLIDDIPTCKELIERIMAEADVVQEKIRLHFSS